VSAALLRLQRATWLAAARDARYRPHVDLIPHYLIQARRVQRQLLALQGVRR
jgi:hypothetical protein